MTTTVTVKTGDKPARVSNFPCGENGQPLESGGWNTIGLVEPNSEQAFYASQHQDILVQELAAPAAEQSDESAD
jgi:hypothetical protein